MDAIPQNGTLTSSPYVPVISAKRHTDARLATGVSSLWLALTCLLNPFNLMAQTGPSTGLEEIIVTATRIPTEWSRMALAVDRVGKDDIQLGRQQLGLDESLVNIPGLFLQNRYNFAQDLRISIRGFGARANFGIRGIKLFADDIPLTTPDGQGEVDSIDIGSAKDIEVIRGPISAMYGSASGGVINITSEEGPESPGQYRRLWLSSGPGQDWRTDRRIELVFQPVCYQPRRISCSLAL
jgi:outer membrane receptor protein involved in Fe transport